MEADTVSGRATVPCALAASLALHVLAAHGGLAHVHAALVRLGPHVVLAPGGSGAGKTSFALAVGRHGGELLADDVVYVDRTATAWPVRRPPHVTATTLASHPGAEVLGPVRDDAVAKLRVRPPVDGAASPRPIDSIVLPTIATNGRTRIEAVEPAAVFAALIGTSALVAIESSPRRAEMIDILAALAHVRAATLVAGTDALADPARLVCAISEWLAD